MFFFFFPEAQRAEERDLRNHTADLAIQIRNGFASQIKEFDFHLEALRHHQRVLNRRWSCSHWFWEGPPGRKGENVFKWYKTEAEDQAGVSVSQIQVIKNPRCFYGEGWSGQIRKTLPIGSTGPGIKHPESTFHDLIASSLQPSKAVSSPHYLVGGLEPILEKALATHSSTLAWKIPWTEEPGRLQAMGSLRVRHDWVTSLSLLVYRVILQAQLQ